LPDVGLVLLLVLVFFSSLGLNLLHLGYYITMALVAVLAVIFM
jgi:hypothetical protein